MPSVPHSAGLFPALLKQWRGRRGLSQLELALAAEVSSRHISFLETARSTPSEEMVLRLAWALDVPLRHINAMLRAAGYEPFYPEPAPDGGLPEQLQPALQMMKAHHDPFPLIVVDRCYDVIDLNAGAMALLARLLPAELLASSSRPNLVRLTFDPKGAQPALLNFEEVGRALLWRLQREVLAQPEDEGLAQLLDEVLAMPTVAPGWRVVDLTQTASPALELCLRVEDRTLKFLTMVMMFQAPQAVALEELRIETWFPVDEQTATFCRGLF